MALVQTVKYRLVSSFLCIVIFLSVGISLSWAQEQDSALGELKLEGKYIERLVLQRKDGHTERFDQPDETIKLPMGEYRLQEVRLGGGYIFRSSRTPIRDWIMITEDKPAVLKVGAPLKHSVGIRRRGRILFLDYRLVGVGGEIYTGRMNRSKPPTFTVYKGDKEIASDKFEFG